tara:strand:- start:739 stop:903 length:165 start_codon:yes stop_codon:yes gene_type:complete
MFFRQPNGKLNYFPNQLTPSEALKRMQREERWCQEHRDELERDSQELFDQMFGG